MTWGHTHGDPPFSKIRAYRMSTPHAHLARWQQASSKACTCLPAKELENTVAQGKDCLYGVAPFSHKQVAHTRPATA